MNICTPVVDDLHRAVLFYPQLAQDHVVDTAEGIAPCVHLLVPETERVRERERGVGWGVKNIRRVPIPQNTHTHRHTHRSNLLEEL